MSLPTVHKLGALAPTGASPTKGEGSAAPAPAPAAPRPPAKSLQVSMTGVRKALLHWKSSKLGTAVQHWRSRANGLRSGSGARTGRSGIHGAAITDERSEPNPIASLGGPLHRVLCAESLPEYQQLRGATLPAAAQRRIAERRGDQALNSWGQPRAGYATAVAPPLVFPSAPLASPTLPTQGQPVPSMAQPVQMFQPAQHLAPYPPVQQPHHTPVLHPIWQPWSPGFTCGFVQNGPGNPPTESTEPKAVPREESETANLIGPAKPAQSMQPAAKTCVSDSQPQPKDPYARLHSIREQQLRLERRRATLQLQSDADRDRILHRVFLRELHNNLPGFEAAGSNIYAGPDCNSSCAAQGNDPLPGHKAGMPPGGSSQKWQPVTHHVQKWATEEIKANQTTESEHRLQGIHVEIEHLRQQLGLTAGS